MVEIRGVKPPFSCLFNLKRLKPKIKIKKISCVFIGVFAGFRLFNTVFKKL